MAKVIETTSTTAPSEFEVMKPIIKHLKSFSKHSAIETTTKKVSMTTTNLLSTKKPDILMRHILSRLKSDSLRQQLTTEVYRIKSLCANSYLSVRKNTIVANVSEEKAFSSKYCK